MKRIFIVLIMLCAICLCSCFKDSQVNSLDAYAALVNQRGGYSSYSIDNPYYFLPSYTFLEDYPYANGTYLWREDASIKSLCAKNAYPLIALLALQYDDQTYLLAKQTMLDEIPAFGDQVYTHGGFTFYENAKYAKKESRFPKAFMMAGYNDEKNTLMFIGMYSGTLAGPSCLEERFLNDIENNFSDFIDTYYGQYYDFNE